MNINRSFTSRLLLLVGGSLAFAATVVGVRAQAPAQQGGGGTGPGAFPGINWTEEQLKDAVAPLRAGRKLTPKSWPNGAKVAVCLSWDMDNETFELAAGNTAPITLSMGEYGAASALPRIMELSDWHKIPGSFYIPAVSGLLYPD